MKQITKDITTMAYFQGQIDLVENLMSNPCSTFEEQDILLIEWKKECQKKIHVLEVRYK